MDEQISRNLWSKKAQLLTHKPVAIVYLLFLSLFLIVTWTNIFNVYPLFGTKDFSDDIILSINRTNGTIPQCPAYSALALRQFDKSLRRSCPDYFRWIDEDLRPWKDTGITRVMVEKAKRFSNFRLVILKGKVYLDRFMPSFQTRDVFTLWGILQLIRLYPGRIPDLELVFNCDDLPSIVKGDYQGANATSVPALFHYCNSKDTVDIVFPDWSFWGWPEVNIRPWRSTSAAIREGNKRIPWKDRVPYAFWKGNPDVSDVRRLLIECNVTNEYDWNARLYRQNWFEEQAQGFKNSDLSKQCDHRYKIYVEGNAWSVSDKYIMGCDSMTLFMEPLFYDFFTRGLVPLNHYWPIRPSNNCRDIKFAVEWGNNHTETAQAIGQAGSNFIHESVTMENVYDYMFHLLHEYAKLLKFKPVIPPKAVEICPEYVAALVDDKGRNYMVESMVKHPSKAPPCTMPPPFDHDSLQAYHKGKERIREKVSTWEKEYWQNQEGLV